MHRTSSAQHHSDNTTTVTYSDTLDGVIINSFSVKYDPMPTLELDAIRKDVCAKVS